MTGVIWVSSDTDCTHVDLLLKVYENVLGYYSMFEHAGSQLVSSGNLMDKTVTFVIKYNRKPQICSMNLFLFHLMRWNFLYGRCDTIAAIKCNNVVKWNGVEMERS